MMCLRGDRALVGRIATLVMWAGLLGLPAVGQEPAPQPPSAVVQDVDAPSTLSADDVKQRITRIEDDKTLDADLKSKLLTVYQQAADLVQAAAAQKTAQEKWAARTADAPQALKTLQTDLATPPGAPADVVPQESGVQPAQVALSQAEADLAAAQKNLKDLDGEAERRVLRRAEMQKAEEEAQVELADVERRLAAKPSPDDPAELTAAQRLLLEARRQALVAATAARGAELRSYEATAELLPLQREAAARRVALLEKQVQQLRDEVNARRRRETAAQAREARQATLQADPALRAAAERNVELAQSRQELAASLEGAARDLAEINRRVAQLKDQFTRVRKRIELRQPGNAVGLLLRKQLDELPDVSAERRKIAERAKMLSDASLELIRFEDERNQLASLDQSVAAVLGTLAAGASDDLRSARAAQARDVLQAQRDFLDGIIRDLNAYIDTLIEEDVRQQELIKTTREFASFSTERVFWIQSAQGSYGQLWSELQRGVAWLLDRDHWRQIARAFWEECVTHPGSAFLMTLLFAAGWLRQRWLGPPLHARGEQAFSAATRTMQPTWEALLLTLLLASPWPALLAWLGWRLAAIEPRVEFVWAFSHACSVVAGLLAPLAFLRAVARPHGLAEAHFKWNRESVETIVSSANWTMFCCLPPAFLVALTEGQPDEGIRHSLGRVAFVLALALFLVPLRRVARPQAGVLASAYQAEPSAWWAQAKWAWAAVVLGMPLFLIGLSLTGYHYTAVQLTTRTLTTGWLVVGTILAYALLLRWAVIAYRNLGLQRLQERRAAAETAASQSPPVDNKPLEIKLSDISQQTRQLLQWLLGTVFVLGIWWTWAGVIPAFRALRSVVLWTLESQGANGVVQQTPITLAELLLSTIILTLTVVLSRNLPSLLELAILKHLPMDAGARYATSTVARYAVTALGLAVAFGALGLEWSQIQWLVAAIGVGLGFGLQDIFANFMSGLVLLFERPIRIGDTVTVGGVTGKVSNIRMRATTITDDDFRELIVPNKEMTTSRVINWTLATMTSRMVIDVRTNPDVDADAVRRILLSVAEKHPLVLKTPPPHALLDSYGENGFNFLLRVYLASMSVWIQLRHELLTQIAAELHAASIPFAIPRRDIRVVSQDGAEGPSWDPRNAHQDSN